VSVLVFILLLAQANPAGERAQKAKEALLRGDSAAAVRLYRDLVKELPEDAGLRLNLALALEGTGDYSSELAQLQMVTRKRPDLTSAWLLTGLALQKLGRAKDAVAPLRTVVTREPENRTALLELADACLASGDPASAALHFGSLIKKDPQLAKGWEGLGLSHAALSKAAFAKLEKMQPRSDWYRLLAAQAEIEKGQFEKAFTLLREINPAIPGVHGLIALVYEKTGHPDWAAIEKAKPNGSGVPRNPFYDQVIEHRELASQAFEKLAGLPESPEIHELLAEAKQEQGHRDEALAEWRRAVELAPHDARLAGKLAESLLTNRIYEEALHILEPLVAANPGNAQWQYLLGDALVRERRTEDAVPHLEAAIRLNSSLVPAQAALGRAYLQLGNAAKAIGPLKLGLAADEEAILFQLAQAYRQTGQTALAEQTLAKQQELIRRQTPAESAFAPAAITAP